MMDYTAEYDRADANKLALLAARQQLEAGQFEAQTKRQGFEQGQRRQNKLATLYADQSMRSNPTALEDALLSDPLTAADGLAARKSRIDAEHTQAQTRKSGADADASSYKLRIDKANQALKDVAAFQSPMQALADLQAKAQAGQLPPEHAQALAQQLQTIQNPQQWAEWQRQTRYRMLDAKDQLEQEWKAKSEARAATNDAATNANRDLIAGPGGQFVPNAPLIKAKTQIAAAGATQAPGMTYMTDKDGNIVGLPTKALLGRTVVANVVTDANKAPLPGKDGGMTEDQGKASGWLAQATTAFSNMEKARGGSRPGVGDFVGRVPLMGDVGNAMRPESRQLFVQAAESLSEALLRAATGAGVNRDEAAQKVRELTPQFGDSDAVISQKRAAVPVYLKSLEARAGRKGTQAAQQATGSAQAPAAPGKVINFGDLK